MKISKVEHRKTAVAAQDGKIQGILYSDPKEKGQNEPVGKVVRHRQQSARRLYNVFNMPQNSKSDGKAVRDLNFALRHLTLTKTDRGNLAFREVREILSDLTSGKAKAEYDLTEKEIQTMITRYLRRSLRNRGEQDHCEEGLLGILCRAEGSRTGKWNQKYAEEFLNRLKKDYENTELASKVEKSISHQNLLVQVDPQTSGFTLSKAQGSGNASNDNGQHCSKKREKDGLKAFLSAYANLDEKKRLDLLCRLRRLIDLYFYGADAVIESDFDPWADHEKGKARTGSFADGETMKKISDFESACSREKQKPDKGLKDRKKALQEECGIAIRKSNMERFRRCRKAVEEHQELYFEDGRINEFWIHHMESAVERLLKPFQLQHADRLSLGWLGESVWKDCLNLLSTKYVAEGKAVYHYAMDPVEENGNLHYGVLQKEAQKGLTSFDYEQIKAVEQLQRETAVHVAAAAGNMSRACVVIPANKKNMEDFMLWDRDQIAAHLNTEFAKKYEGQAGQNDLAVTTSVLQYFGGVSKWDLQLFQEAFADQDYGFGTCFVYDLKQAVYSLRNESFHFDTRKKTSADWNQKLLGLMFEKDASASEGLQRKKFYSNNLPMFYSDADLKTLLDALYEKQVMRNGQVPSFNTVFVRRNWNDFVTQLGWQYSGPSENRVKWLSAVYYACKEIYYNLFLADEKTAKDDFTKAVKQLNTKGSNNADAVRNFQQVFWKLEDRSMSEICQYYMTEYNAQNAGQRRVKSHDMESKDPAIYQHYRMLLFLAIREAFAEYLKQEKFAFLKTAVCKEEMETLESFLPDWKSGMYTSLVEQVKDSPELQKWYVTARFLDGRSLSHMVGSLRSFLQYEEDIERRARENGNQLITPQDSLKRYCSNAIGVVDLCLHMASDFSGKITDYFATEDQYAAYLKAHLDYGMGKEGEGVSPFGQLKIFCEEMAGSAAAGIYTDGQNPILNRNIVMSKLFGQDQIVSAVVPKVGRNDIQKLAELEKKIQGYLKTGVCSTVEEQKALLDYQRLKNHVELRDVVEYGEILNELQGQLLNWAFLRERDLLYFQLGFHYLCLRSDSPKPEAYSTIAMADGRKIEGAILPQVEAMYISGVPMYTSKDNQLVLLEKGSTGARVVAFLRYTKYAYGGEKAHQEDFYNAGLELFENLKEHDNIVDIRDYIDHFKYFTQKKADGAADQASVSMLDLYSEMFDRFFSYDMKYRKNVVVLLENILLQHFVIIRPKFTSSLKKVGKDGTKERAQIDIRSIASDKMTYKIAAKKKDGGKQKASETSVLTTDARNAEFLRTVGELLYYPKKMPENVQIKTDIDTTSVKNAPAEQKKPGNRNNTHYNKPNNKSNQKGNTSKDTFASHSFDMLSQFHFKK